MKFTNKLFKLEILDGDGICQKPYMYRWTLFSFFRLFKVYLHCFLDQDWTKDYHDHPKRFISIGLKGRYIEETPIRKGMIQNRVYQAPWIRTFPASYIHRIKTIPGETCWTLVIVFKSQRAWGFWANGEWIPWRQYVDSDRAVEMKSCPD